MSNSFLKCKSVINAFLANEPLPVKTNFISCFCFTSAYRGTAIWHNSQFHCTWLRHWYSIPFSLFLNFSFTRGRFNSVPIYFSLCIYLHTDPVKTWRRLEEFHGFEIKALHFTCYENKCFKRYVKSWVWS